MCDKYETNFLPLQKKIMRVSSAVVRFVLKRNRKNKFGEYPVYLVVSYHGRSERATGVSVSERYWDSGCERVRPKCPNAGVLNDKLFQIKKKILEKKAEYERNGVIHTHQMLIEAISEPLSDDLTFGGVMLRCVKDKRVSASTEHSYQYAARKLKEFFGREPLVTEITSSKLKDYAKWLEGEIKNNSIRCVVAYTGAVVNYAIEKDIVQMESPTKGYKYTRKYSEKARDYFLSPSHMVRLKEYWLNMVINRSAKMWSYKDNAFDKLGNRNSAEFGILWFLLCYKFNGSAPIEIAKLRPTDVKRVTINGKEYFSIDIERQKTKTQVHIRLPRDVFSIIALEHFLGRCNGKYVYPIIPSYVEDDKRMLKSSHHAAEKAVKCLRKAFNDINGDIARDNVDKRQKEPQIESERVVLYTARHSFAQHYLSSPNATVAGLASLLARSPNTIATYIAQITRDEDVASMVENMPI